MKKAFLLLTICSILLSGCSKKEILPGKREDLFVANVNGDSINKSVVSVKITPLSAQSRSSHICVAGNLQHNNINRKMAVNEKLTKLWKVSIGSGPITADPIIFDNKIFAVDARGTLSCVEAQTGKILWDLSIAKQPESGIFSGGLTANNGIIYIATNIGTVVAVDSKTKKILWKISIKIPLKGAPVCWDSKVIVTSVENQTYALDAKTGKTIWTKTMEHEQTIMEESASPAVSGTSLICPYTSGDIVAMNSKGVENWADMMLSGNSSESGSIIFQIVSIVCDKNFVLVTTATSNMSLLDSTTGIRIWEREFGSLVTPIIHGDWVFGLLNDNRLVCLSLKDGTTKWQMNLASILQEKREKEARWVGMQLINGNVVVFSTFGHVASFDISTGKLKNVETLKNVGFARNPIIVNGTMLAITNRAEIHAFK
ncbi:hypothetical protein FACS1894113_3050 [Alphaproteobacteria bacterium]|nr:hypothetical protein FACS1894113_3050 [Alphaproteobacteria bacterium]